MKLKRSLFICVALALLLSLVGCDNTRDIELTDEDIHTDCAGVYLTLSSSDGNETLNTVWHNETEQQISFGEYYYIEMLENGEWKSVLAEEMIVTAIGLLLPAHSTQGKAYSTRDFDLSREGTYRIRCEFYTEDGQPCSTYATFEVKSGASRGASDSTSGTSQIDTTVPVDTSRADLHDDYDIRVSWANWLGDALYGGCLNHDKMAISSVRHLPINKFGSCAELDAFKASFGEDNSFDHGYGGASFNENTADYDDAFFAENDLFLVYVGANSGSLKFDVGLIALDSTGLVIYVEQTNDPQECTDDMAGWFITVALPRSATEGCTVFDAVMGVPQ